MKLNDFLAKSPSWLQSLVGQPIPDIDLIKKREGLVLKWYKDTLGHWTAGYGHLRKAGDPDVVTQAIADTWLQEDIGTARASALAECEQLPFYTKELLDTLVSVNYQLGTAWEKKFPSTFGLMKEGKYDEAAWALESSLWNKQTPVRVRDLQRSLWRTQMLWEAYKAAQ
jgi:lysozyme